MQILPLWSSKSSISTRQLGRDQSRADDIVIATLQFGDSIDTINRGSGIHSGSTVEFRG